MDKIKLLCVENVITRQATMVHQRLSVAVLVANTRVPQERRCQVGRRRRRLAHAARALSQQRGSREGVLGREEDDSRSSRASRFPETCGLPLRYRVAGKEYWDNNHGHNYSIQADSGIRVAQDIPVLNVRFESEATDGQTVFPVVVAVQRHLEPERVQLTWTNDNWRTTHSTQCRFKRNYWDYRTSAATPGIRITTDSRSGTAR